MIKIRSTTSFLTLLLAGSVSAAYGQAVTPIMGVLPAGTLHTVNNGPGDQAYPNVSGNIVTYNDVSVGQAHIFNLATGQDTIIPFAGPSYDGDVDGSTVVYTQYQGGAQSVASYDINTSISDVLAPSTNASLAEQLLPTIGAGTVAWEDFTLDGIHSEIVAYDRASGVTTQLTALDGSFNNTPAVSPSGTTIVWQKCTTNSSAGCSIWEADLAAGVWTTKALTATDPIANGSLQVDTDGTTVVYASIRGGVSGLYWQPVGGGPEHQLVWPGHNVFYPHISRGVISFNSFSNTAPNRDLMVYTIASNTVYPVLYPATTPHFYDSNDIWVGADGTVQLAWAARETDFNVYAYTFQLPAADVAVKTYPAGAQALSGSLFLYVLAVHNGGPQSATDVSLTETLPSGTTFITAVPTQGSCNAPMSSVPENVVCSLKSLNNGAYAFVGIVVKVGAAPGSVLVNTADVTTSSFDSNLTNNSFQTSTPVK